MTLAVGVVMLLLLGIGPSSSTSADIFTNEPRLVELGAPLDDADAPLIGLGISISRNARYATFEAGNTWYHVDLASGATTELALKQAVATNDPNLVAGTVFNRQWLRYDPVTEVVGSMEAVLDPIVTIEIGLDPTKWGPAIVQDSTPNGRYQLLAARDLGDPGTNWFVYDASAESLMTPLSGLPTLNPGHRSHEVRFIGDEGTIDYFARRTFGSRWESHERLNYITGHQTSIPAPPGYFGSGWGLSPDRSWMVFITASTGILPGLDGTPRLYRRHVATGETSLVPVHNGDAAGLKGHAVYNDGSVVYRESYTDPAEQDALSADQLYVWNGVDPVRMATIGIDGRPADRGIESFAMSETGPTALFTSWSLNLADDVAAFGEPGYRGRLLYVLDGFEESPSSPPAGESPSPGPVPPSDPAPQPDDVGGEPDTPRAAESMGAIGSAADAEWHAARCSMSPSC